MPLPAAHMLVGAAAAEGVRAALSLPRLRVWAVGAAFGLLPDVDYVIRILTGEWAPLERSATHSLLATVLVVVVVGLIGGRQWAAVSGAGYASHLLIDLMQHQVRSSVAPFWPLQERGMEPILRLFPYVPIQRGEGVGGAARSLFTEAVLTPMVKETAIAVAIFLTVLLAAGMLRWARPHPDRRQATATASDPPR